MKRKVLKKFTVLLLAFTMLFTMAVPAWATEIPEAPTKSEIEQQLQVIRAGGTDVKSGAIESLLKGFASAAGTAAVKWGVDKLLNSLFGGDDKYDYMEDMLKNISAQQTEILQRMNELSNLIKTERYQDILDEYNKTSTGAGWMINQMTSTLSVIDDKYKDYFDEDGNVKEEYAEALKSARLAALTTGIGISDDHSESAVENIDTCVGDLYNMMTTTYAVPVGKQASVNRNFYEVYREYMRLNYHWEHQAYDSMEKFNNAMTANFLSLAMLEQASLQARYTKCVEKGLATESIEARMKNLKKEVAEVGTLYKNNRVVRNSSYRHFWVPDYEVYLLPQVKQQNIPTETTGSVGEGYSNVKGLKNKEINWSFWDPFWSSITESRGTTFYYYPKMAGTDEVNNLLNGCNNRMTLKEILEEGGYSLGDKNVLLLDKNDSKNPVTLDKDSVSSQYNYWHSYRIHPRGVNVSRKAAVGSASKIGTYEYYDSWTYPAMEKWVVYDEIDSSEKYFTLGVKCDHKWDTRMKGLTEFGDCTKCGASYVNSEVTAPQPVDPQPAASAPTITKIKRMKGCFSIRWKKDAQADGYIIQYSKKKSFSTANTISIRNNKTVYKKIKKLKKCTNYYVRVACYEKDDKGAQHLYWSKALKIKTK